ncbi:VWA domain-containing protein [Streptomonospora nanhaiensis]|uniref:VWA domain-containing protein n=1 Tax=Streptomonospora nanhaiensis TaxID=1323731 RepID=A0ABY6YT78_9ACTN|nr:vWA domain-containing protein [Streptomonospora nanhaiensis]WAE75556.1 VWA domain-containing protein [Streptomonospora nanhaiensis]
MATTPRVKPAGSRTALVATLLLLLGPAVPLPAHAGARAPQPGESAPVPLDIVVLVDESGSLDRDDVEAEANAASTIAQSVLDPGSRVTVVGFGSNNGESGQIAAREVCRPTLVDEDGGRQYLADCVDGLERREDSEGDDTDHAEALGAALGHLTGTDSPDGSSKIVFLLTDGALDVRDSPQYGAAERRNDNAAALVGEHLEQAAEHGVRIWPLGFGSAIDRDQLDAFAAGGSQDTCNDLEVSAPVARVADDSSDVARSLQEALAAASCSQVGEPADETLAGGGRATLEVDIPLVATDGALMVTKNNPAIRVEYLDPEGETVDTGAAEHRGSPITVSGENSPVEVLRLVDPMPGTWSVRLTSPEGTPEELVTARAQWKGFINTFLRVEGGQDPGELVVRVDIRTRRGPITSPEALADLEFSAEAAFPDGSSTPVEIGDGGEAPDSAAGDGQYAGTVSVPEGTDEVTFTSRVQGPGVPDDVHEYVYTFDPGGSSLRPSVSFGELPEQVWSGQEVAGTLTVTNQGPREETVELVLAPSEGLLATIAQDTSGFAPGSSRSDFTVRFGEGSALGPATLNVLAVDARGEVLHTSPTIATTVRSAPGVLERYWWIWAPLAALVLLGGGSLLLGLKKARERRDVGGIVVTLHRDGGALLPPLTAPARRSTVFAFTVREEAGADPRLDHARGPGPARVHEVRRHRSGGVLLRTADGRERLLRFGQADEPLSGGLTVSFEDGRTRRREPSPPPAQHAHPRSPGPGAAAPEQGPPTDGIHID